MQKDLLVSGPMGIGHLPVEQRRNLPPPIPRPPLAKGKECAPGPILLLQPPLLPTPPAEPRRQALQRRRRLHPQPAQPGERAQQATGSPPLWPEAKARYLDHRLVIKGKAGHLISSAG